jgi:hypothetical protein
MENTAEHDGKNGKTPKRHIITVPKRNAGAYRGTCKGTDRTFGIIIVILGNVHELRNSGSRKINEGGNDDPEYQIETDIITDSIHYAAYNAYSQTHQKAQCTELEIDLDYFIACKSLRLIHRYFNFNIEVVKYQPIKVKKSA